MTPLHTIFPIATATGYPAAPLGVGLDYHVANSTSEVLGLFQTQPIETVSQRFAVQTGRSLVDASPQRLGDPAPPTAKLLALERLRKFANWGPNWDGEGALAPKAKTLSAAANLLGLLEDEILKTPAVALNTLGEPTFILMDGDREMSISLSSPSVAAFYVCGGNFEEAGSVRFGQDRLPRRLVNALQAAGIS